MRKTTVIIHLDMDAFFAAVEQREHPELKGRPVIVGGHSARGVVSACSYEVRRYGVCSAMPIKRALRLCPQAIVLPVRMSLYQDISEQVFSIFRRYTDLVEPLSIDEAFLDVTRCYRLYGPARAIAHAIRRDIQRELGLTASAGIASNKFLAKLASQAAKPDGLREILPDEVDDFLLPLPLSRFWGVGQAMTGRLAKLGIRTVEDLRRSDSAMIARQFGASGKRLLDLARGIDPRPVDPFGEIKSIGNEETFEQDLGEDVHIRAELLRLAERVAWRLRKQNLMGRCITVKTRFEDFTTLTRSRTLREGVNHAPDLFREALKLYQLSNPGKRTVRLLGVSVSGLEQNERTQGDLFDLDHRSKHASLNSTVDQLKARYGLDSVKRGTLIDGGPSSKKRVDPVQGSKKR